MFLNAFKLKFGWLDIQFDPEKYSRESPFKSHVSFFDHFEEAFERLIARWVHGKGNYHRIQEEQGALVIFVDDLDRCLPEKTVQVLEAVKLFLDKMGCIFVLGADTRLVREAITLYYEDKGVTGDKAGDYLEKIIQLRFDLPPIQEGAMGEYIQETPVSDELMERLWRVLVTGAEVNPRKVKTFLNDLNLAWAMLVNSEQAEGMDQADFTRWHVLMRAAPENFKRRVRYIEKKEIRLKFIRDALRWAKGDEKDETLQATFDEFSNRRLERVLRAIGSFGDRFNADMLNAFLYRISPPQSAIQEEEKATEEKPVRGMGRDIQQEVKTMGGIDFVPVPAGEFLMGSSQDDSIARDNEFPQHTVDIPYQYWIGRYPVTNEQFKMFTDATGYVTRAENEGGWNPDEGKYQKGFNWRTPLGPRDPIGNKGKHPVVQLSWEDARAYIKWLNKEYKAELPNGYQFHLPSEAEWEKAARGEYAARWPWGDEWNPDNCNSKEKGPDRTTPVGQYSPAGDSPYGAADMAGNVWEWTRSLFKEYPYETEDGREDLGAEGSRVLRGGAFSIHTADVRCAYRRGLSPDLRYNDVGFRVVVSPRNERSE
jgi:formylglycine-generating enzyme required for sulfatase activity